MKQALIILQSCQYKIEDALEFAQSNSLKGDKIEELTKELSTDLLSKVDYSICKCQAKFLKLNNFSSNNKKTGEEPNKKDAAKNQKTIEFDNVYDVLFDDALKQKSDSNKQKKVVIGQNDDQRALLNFLETGNLQIQPIGEGQEFELSKVKLSKQFKLISALPKLQSVPATPQFFDMAGGYIQYPDTAQEAKKFEVQSVVSSGIWGLFGG